MQSVPESIGPYKVLQELGRGKRTIVYKAWQPATECEVALKVLRQNDAETLRRFEDEVRLSSNLHNPGVRQIHEAGRTPEGYVYVAMEYVERSLKMVIRRRFSQHQTFGREEVASLLKPIAQALDDIHRQGLVHLDIKPDNILVSQEGNAVLADFGITRRRGEKTHEGTPLYLSPEQASGQHPIGPWSDIYSLGVLVYEMLTGRTPFVSERDFVLVRQHLEDAPPAPRTLRPDLQRDLERVLLAALNKDPSRRPRTAGDLLLRVQGGRSAVRSTMTAPLYVLSGVVHRHLYLTLASLGILLLAGLALWGWRYFAPERPPVTTTVPTFMLPSASPPDAPTLLLTSQTVQPSPEPPPTSTSLRVTRTPLPQHTLVRPASPPVLVWPSGDLSESDKTATFVWEGNLRSGQEFFIEWEHYDSDAGFWTPVKSDTCTEPRYTYDLPEPGNWRWRVRIEPRGTPSEWMEFWLRLYGP